jgi:RimJ/RimL family protein N-acetyltransferase
MAESLQAVIDYCFRTIGMDWIEACTEEGNESSTRLLGNLGFVQINKVIDQGYNTDRLYNMLVFRKVKQ